ncbi:hypothetical protein GCM10009760_57930 [Kitasatospora kazusensis]|uniref:N-acetyltransferase domain-containing protein n=1 Tax=Kitasatospora kazusensis TaxID=407974 RepID=A0ABN3AAR7_9ACTN
MGNRGRLEQANDNAVGFWSAQAEVQGWEHVRREGYTAVRCARAAGIAHRVVITRPYGDHEGLAATLAAELTRLLQEWGPGELCLEDPYLGLDLRASGRESSLEMPVMTREPGPLPAGPPVGCGAGQATMRGRGLGTGASGEVRTVGEVTDAEGLAAAERTVVEGFPVSGSRPWSRGGLLPEALLAVPGCRVWLARVDGSPASACVTYDDGEAMGVYWMATLPEHRSKGLARMVVEAALAAHPDRVSTLVATLLGEPLYRRLGFTEQGLTRWWR